SHNTADKHHLRGEGAGDFLKIFPPLSWPMGQESGGMPTLTQFKLHSRFQPNIGLKTRNNTSKQPNIGHKTRNNMPKQSDNGPLQINIGSKPRNNPSKQPNIALKTRNNHQNSSTMSLC
ncbi:MAG TPA: hypothetical protein VF008_17355, partial [Niastella sp.]